MRFAIEGWGLRLGGIGWIDIRVSATEKKAATGEIYPGFSVSRRTSKPPICCCCSSWRGFFFLRFFWKHFLLNTRFFQKVAQPHSVKAQLDLHPTRHKPVCGTEQAWPHDLCLLFTITSRPAHPYFHPGVEEDESASCIGTGLEQSAAVEATLNITQCSLAIRTFTQTVARTSPSGPSGDGFKLSACANNQHIH